jgi:ABC-type Zn2+ transport system substrate-binding protein/surface adhesin
MATPRSFPTAQGRGAFVQYLPITHLHQGASMDHQEQHHQKHEHEREHEKMEHKKHEHEQEKNLLPFHPAWLIVVGTVLVLAAVLVWSLVWT